VHSSMSIPMLVLNDTEIHSLLSFKCAIELVESAFAADARHEVTTLPVISHLIERFQANFVVKAGHIELSSGLGSGRAVEVLGLKAGSFWGSNSKRGLPSHNAVMVMIEPETGRPCALLAANTLTTVRTAAAGAIASKYLAPKRSRSVAILGAGEQGQAQLEALLEVKLIERACVWDISADAARAYAEFWSKQGLRTEASPSVKDAVRDAQIIVTATPARSPILKSEYVTRGVHINAVGSDSNKKQEIQAQLVARCRTIVDKREQSISIGEMRVPLQQGLVNEAHIEGELGEICAGLKPGRRSDDELTLFDSSGVSFQDLIVVDYVIRAATEQKLGQHILV